MPALEQDETGNRCNHRRGEEDIDPHMCFVAAHDGDARTNSEAVYAANYDRDVGTIPLLGVVGHDLAESTAFLDEIGVWS